MSDDNEKFEYSYSAPTEQQRREVNSIRNRYLPHEEDEKVGRLKKLDARVRSGAMAVGLTLGIGGCLLFGLGMSMVLVWGLLVWGSVVAAVGIVPMAFAHFAHNKILERGKNKYGDEILRLTDEILKDENE